MLEGADFGALIAVLQLIFASTVDQTHHDYKTTIMENDTMEQQEESSSPAHSFRNLAVIAMAARSDVDDEAIISLMEEANR
jgi:hypothetical protein